MGALNPLFLLAGLAVGVPIYLHLFQRHETRRLSFPALRYLERTEREHARQIRFRQLLLLLARIAALLLIVGAGARVFFSGRGSAHARTAVVIVLDNSLSSGLVVGEDRLLDQFKALASRTLASASDEDRFWLIRAGEPWVPAIPGNAIEAGIAVEDTDASEAGGDLTAAIERAVRLLETADFENREIHVLSDLQRTAFDLPGSEPAGDIPVIVWNGRRAEAVNHALVSVVVGGGLPPLEGQRTNVTVSARDAVSEDDTTATPLRLVVNDRIRGAATLPPGAQASIAMPPAGTGWIRGYADSDADALRADDRRFFAYRSRPAPTISVGGAPGVFVAEALAVLEGAARVRVTSPESADLVIAGNGEGLDRRAADGAAFVLPLPDPGLLPAINRRLGDAGIPWRLDVRETPGEAELEGRVLPEPLDGVRVRQWFQLSLIGDPPAPTRTVAEVDGQPWAVEGTDSGGRDYLLIASPLDADATTLPVSTGMLRFMDWVTSEWAGSGGSGEDHLTGETISAPAGATHVRLPSGDVLEIDGTRAVRGTGAAGFYSFLMADTVLSVVALNPPPSESDLTPLEAGAFTSSLGRRVIDVDRESEWARAVFRARQGPELWWPLVLAVTILLLAEALMATSGTARRGVVRAPARGTGPGGGA